MIYSMTGYGKGNAENKKMTVEVEIKSVNSRYLDISLRLPSSLMNKEYELREFIKSKVSRGKIGVSIQLKKNGGSADLPEIDKEKLKNYLSQIKELKKAAKLTEKIKLQHLLDNKDLYTSSNGEYSEDDFNLIKNAISDSIKSMLKMKANEGKELAKDLKKRIEIIDQALVVIEKETKESSKEYYGKLKEKVKSILDENNYDEQRMTMELAVIAEKADITEECVRLRSHMKFFSDSLTNENDPGRKLNFLCQEMNRETNTISSKSISTIITHKTVMIKEEIEKIREQIQNIE